MNGNCQTDKYVHGSQRFLFFRRIYPSAGSKRLIAITTVTRVPRSADVRQPICFLRQRPSIVAFLSWGVGNNWLV